MAQGRRAQKDKRKLEESLADFGGFQGFVTTQRDKGFTGAEIAQQIQGFSGILLHPTTIMSQLRKWSQETATQAGSTK